MWKSFAAAIVASMLLAGGAFPSSAATSQEWNATLASAWANYHVRGCVAGSEEYDGYARLTSGIVTNVATSTGFVEVVPRTGDTFAKLCAKNAWRFRHHRTVWSTTAGYTPDARFTIERRVVRHFRIAHRAMPQVPPVKPVVGKALPAAPIGGQVLPAAQAALTAQLQTQASRIAALEEEVAHQKKLIGQQAVQIKALASTANQPTSTPSASNPAPSQTKKFVDKYADLSGKYQQLVEANANLKTEFEQKEQQMAAQVAALRSQHAGDNDLASRKLRDDLITTVAIIVILAMIGLAALGYGLFRFVQWVSKPRRRDYRKKDKILLGEAVGAVSAPAAGAPTFTPAPEPVVASASRADAFAIQGTLKPGDVIEYETAPERDAGTEARSYRIPVRITDTVRDDLRGSELEKRVIVYTGVAPWGGVQFDAAMHTLGDIRSVILTGGLSRAITGGDPKAEQWLRDHNIGLNPASHVSLFESAHIQETVVEHA